MIKVTSVAPEPSVFSDNILLPHLEHVLSSLTDSSFTSSMVYPHVPPTFTPAILRSSLLADRAFRYRVFLGLPHVLCLAVLMRSRHRRYPDIVGSAMFFAHVFIAPIVPSAVARGLSRGSGQHEKLNHRGIKGERGNDKVVEWRVG